MSFGFTYVQLTVSQTTKNILSFYPEADTASGSEALCFSFDPDNGQYPNKILL
jgi:hypothetical protein